MTRISCLFLILAACASSPDNHHEGIPPNCGDGVVQADEQCDDGNTIAGDGCSEACAVESGNPSCGDGILETGEQCDDGNVVGHDGCSATCETEPSDVPCTPNSYRCGPGGDVEVCNNAGSAWLFVNSCAIGCSGGVCTDPTCAPGATRCHGDAVETCNAAGDGWSATETCTTYCAAGQCALPTLTVGSNSNYDGAVIVAGDFVVTGNSTLTASSGDLTIIADNIRVEAGAAIAVSPTGENLRGASCVSSYYGYAANYGQPYSGTRIWSPYGGEADASVEPGSIGGRQGYYGCTTNVTFTVPPTHGGGTLRLIARHDVTIAGQLLVAGENARSGDPYGGSGGGIQIAGNTIAAHRLGLDRRWHRRQHGIRLWPRPSDLRQHAGADGHGDRYGHAGASSADRSDLADAS